MNKQKVVIIGGGYAGLRAAIQLSRQTEVLLCDRKSFFSDPPKLMRALSLPIQDVSVQFKSIAERFGFQFLLANFQFNLDELNNISKVKKINLGNQSIDFDHLIVATGAEPDRKFVAEKIFYLSDFSNPLRQEKFLHYLNNHEERKLTDTPIKVLIIGGGASSVEILFHLKEKFREFIDIVFISRQNKILPFMDGAVSDYIIQKMKNNNVEVYLNANCDKLAEKRDGQLSEKIADEGTAINASIHYLPTNIKFDLNVDLVLMATGVQPNPFSLHTNSFGQVLFNDYALSNVWAAGDCSIFSGNGLNSMDAQAAVRKADQVAHNIIGRKLPYNYEQLGYFVSLGSWDGAGWLLHPQNIVYGLSAYVIKEAIEAQFQLFIQGVDNVINDVMQSVKEPLFALINNFFINNFLSEKKPGK